MDIYILYGNVICYFVLIVYCSRIFFCVSCIVFTYPNLLFSSKAFKKQPCEKIPEQTYSKNILDQGLCLLFKKKRGWVGNVFFNLFPLSNSSCTFNAGLNQNYSARLFNCSIFFSFPWACSQLWKKERL